MPKQNKRINITRETVHHKQVRQIIQPDSFFDKKPCWRFQFVDKEEWTPLGHMDDIVSKLCAYEKMTWAEIDGMPKAGIDTRGSRNHFVSVNDMCKKAQIRIDNLHLLSDEYYSIALSGRSRLWGILDDGVFSILWYDQDHEVCPSLKRHT